MAFSRCSISADDWPAGKREGLRPGVAHEERDYLASLLTSQRQHLAASGPNVEILREFLSQGASVHLRNREGHTPLYLAAHAGLRDHVRLLREAGAHLHAEETASASLHAVEKGSAEVWRLAGVGENGSG